MGAGEVSSAVSDAGPLIHLSQISALSLLTLFAVLHVPDAVWQETVGRRRVAEDQILALSIVRRHALLPADLSRFTQENGLEALHDGERECLCLCHQLGVPVLLTDDLAVREASGPLGVTPVGSLGIVARAYRLGRVSLADAERHIEELYDVSTLFVTRAIVDLAIDQLRRHPGDG